MTETKKLTNRVIYSLVLKYIYDEALSVWFLVVKGNGSPGLYVLIGTGPPNLNANYCWVTRKTSSMVVIPSSTFRAPSCRMVVMPF